jgi:hypothetical protein
MSGKKGEESMTKSVVLFFVDWASRGGRSTESSGARQPWRLAMELENGDVGATWCL